VEVCIFQEDNDWSEIFSQDSNRLLFFNKVPSLGKSYVFPCARWLAKDEDDHLIVRELLPDPAAAHSFAALKA
jgi:hypothetical protein